jgi:hypothetical protein
LIAHAIVIPRLSAAFALAGMTPLVMDRRHQKIALL